MVSAEPLGPSRALEADVFRGAIERNDSLARALGRAGMKPIEVDELVRALKERYDFRNAQPGHAFTLARLPADPAGAPGRLNWFRYEAGPTTIIHAFRNPAGALEGLAEDVNVMVRRDFVSGQIDQSLYLAMESAGEKPLLTMSLVDLFSWDIDFFTETQAGDKFRLIVEKQFVDGRFVAYGKILGAEYKMAAGKTIRAFHYKRADGKSGYYTEDGRAIEKSFLKSPIQFASITSKYGTRKHPILNYVGKHKGVDYGAPSGTSVWAVAGGTVTFAGKRGGYGNVVIIRHRNGLETRYAHLKGFARGIGSGRSVEQKQVIGYVGATGLATGPHLHFEVLQGGRHTNPLRLVVTPSPPIPGTELETYKVAIRPVLEALENGTTEIALR